jgi:hypothetical protein
MVNTGHVGVSWSGLFESGLEWTISEWPTPEGFPEHSFLLMKTCYFQVHFFGIGYFFIPVRLRWE